MQRILALDLARVSGAAWRDSDGGIASCAFVLGKEGNLPAHLVALGSKVDSLLAETGAEVVSIEMDFGRGSGSTTLRSYHAVAMMSAQRAGATVVRKLNASAARKRALGYGGGDKAYVEQRAKMLLGLPEVCSEGMTSAIAKLAVSKGLVDFEAVNCITNDELDASVLLVATESLIEEEARVASWKKLAAAQSRSKKKVAA